MRREQEARPGRHVALSDELTISYDSRMDLFAPAEATAALQLRERQDIPDRFKWNLSHIFPDWADWQARLRRARAQDRRVRRAAGHAGAGRRPSAGGDEALATTSASSTYKVWYFASLKYDEDQRDNQINARRQQVQILFAKASQASAWFNPELLQIPLPTVQQWMDGNAELAVYRFAIEDLYRQQEHVLDEKGEHLLSLASRFSSAPNDAYAALSTADVKFPTITLSTGAEVTLTYGQYRAILATNRNQSDRAAAFDAFHQLYAANVNTYASLYNGVLQRDWFHAQARGYRIDARRGAARQQHPDGGGREPDRDDQGGRRAAAALSPPAQARARARHLSHLRHGDSARRLRSQVSVRRRAGVAAGVGRAARRRVPAAAARGARAAAGSTSTRTRASAAARTRRRCTACTRTCC